MNLIEMKLRLKELRNRAKLTQEKMAELIGYSGQSGYAMVEKGNQYPEFEKILKFCEVTDSEIWELFYSPDDMSKSFFGDQEFSQLYFSLDQNSREVVKNVMRGLRGQAELEKDVDQFEAIEKERQEVGAKLFAKKSKDE